MRDQSYDDALFDASLRFSLQNNFDKIEPPQNIYNHVLLAIESSKAKPVKRLTPARRSVVSQIAESLYRAIREPAAARMLPSALALILLAAVMGTDMAKLLAGQPRNYDPSTYTVSAPSQVGPSDASTSAIANRGQRNLDDQSARTPLSTTDDTELMLVDETRITRQIALKLHNAQIRAEQDDMNYKRPILGPQ